MGTNGTADQGINNTIATAMGTNTQDGIQYFEGMGLLKGGNGRGPEKAYIIFAAKSLTHLLDSLGNTVKDPFSLASMLGLKISTLRPISLFQAKNSAGYDGFQNGNFIFDESGMYVLGREDGLK